MLRMQSFSSEPLRRSRGVFHPLNDPAPQGDGPYNKMRVPSVENTSLMTRWGNGTSSYEGEASEVHSNPPTTLMFFPPRAAGQRKMVVIVSLAACFASLETCSNASLDATLFRSVLAAVGAKSFDLAAGVAKPTSLEQDRCSRHRMNDAYRGSPSMQSKFLRLAWDLGKVKDAIQHANACSSAAKDIPTSF